MGSTPYDARSDRRRRRVHLWYSGISEDVSTSTNYGRANLILREVRSFLGSRRDEIRASGVRRAWLEGLGGGWSECGSSTHTETPRASISSRVDRLMIRNQMYRSGRLREAGDAMIDQAVLGQQRRGRGETFLGDYSNRSKGSPR